MYRDGLSIAVLNQNRELLLPRSIASALRALPLLEADGVPGEVMVVDEGSRDGSPALLRQLEARHYADGLRVLALPVRGAKAARDRALAGARFRFAVLMGAEDELVPENLPNFLRTLRATGSAAVYGNLLFRSVTSECAHFIVGNESMQGVTFERPNLGGFALFDRLQLLDAGGFGNTDAAPEDAEIWLHLACHGRRVAFAPLVFGYHYILPDTPADAEAGRARLRRTFDEVAARKHLPFNAERLRYHPAVGYL